MQVSSVPDVQAYRFRDSFSEGLRSGSRRKFRVDNLGSRKFLKFLSTSTNFNTCATRASTHRVRKLKANQLLADLWSMSTHWQVTNLRQVQETGYRSEKFWRSYVAALGGALRQYPVPRRFLERLIPIFSALVGNGELGNTVRRRLWKAGHGVLFLSSQDGAQVVI